MEQECLELGPSQATSVCAGRDWSVVLLRNGSMLGVSSLHSVSMAPLDLDDVEDVSSFQDVSWKHVAACSYNLACVSEDGFRLSVFSVENRCSVGLKLTHIFDVQLPLGVQVALVSIADRHLEFCSTDGRLFSAQYKRTPRIVAGLEDQHVVNVSIGPLHSLVLTKQGDVYSRGFNGAGRLGLGHVKDSHSLSRVNASRIVEVRAAKHHSVIRDDEGRIFTFGYGKGGRLGHNGYDRISEVCTLPEEVCLAKLHGLSPLVSFKRIFLTVVFLAMVYLNRRLVIRKALGSVYSLMQAVF